MALSLDPELFSTLNQLEDNVLDQLCKASFDCLKNGTSSSTLDFTQNENAKKLTKHTMTLIVQSLKFGLSDSELNDLLTTLNCNNYYKTQLVQAYKQKRPDLTKILLCYDRNSSSSTHRYVRLSWKVEVKIHSKYINERSRLEPIVMLRFQVLNNNGKPIQFDIQCTAADIYHIVDRLSEALQSQNSQTSIKLLKQIK